MRAVNVIMLFSEDRKKILLCKRRKDPYKGLYNLVGGKIEPGEAGLAAAYRELYEETGVHRDEIRLVHIMDFTYYLTDCRLELYAGGLRGPKEVYGEENDLIWFSINENFFDMTRFAGKGNIGHMLEQVKLAAEQIFDPVNF